MIVLLACESTEHETHTSCPADLPACRKLDPTATEGQGHGAGEVGHKSRLWRTISVKGDVLLLLAVVLNPVNRHGNLRVVLLGKALISDKEKMIMISSYNVTHSLSSMHVYLYLFDR